MFAGHVGHQYLWTWSQGAPFRIDRSVHFLTDPFSKEACLAIILQPLPHGPRGVFYRAWTEARTSLDDDNYV